jgi:hypothetical protein
MMRQENLETTEDTENTETLCSLASHIPISSPLKANCQVPAYRFFLVHWSMRSRACCRFSSEFATLKRR